MPARGAFAAGLKLRAGVAAMAVVAAGASIVVAPHATGAPIAGTQTTLRHAVIGGEGFDTCSAPSSGTMRAWLASPYRTVNIYFAGGQRRCQGSKQAELTRAWIDTVTANGWSLIPTYVGLQPPCSTTRKQKISTTGSTAEQQGHAAAADAVTYTPTGLAALGLPHGTPAYLDLENFFAGTSAACDRAVRRFAKGWMDELRSRGYRAGIYGTPRGAIQVLVEAHHADPAYPLPDAIWFADYTYDYDSVHSRFIPDGYLAKHRIHQYVANLNKTYAGIELNIDKDKMGGDVEQAASYTVPGGPPYPYSVMAPHNSDGTSGTVKVRLSPQPDGALATPVSTLPDTTQINIDCQATGGKVFGDYVWDRIPNPNTADIAHPWAYVSDLYTNTTGGNGISNVIQHCDRIPPTATLQPLPRVRLPSSIVVSYSGTDPSNGAPDDQSGVNGYDVQWRRAPYNGGFGSWHRAASQTTATRTTIADIPPGYTYCVEVRAYDRATNHSPWTPQSCTTRPLDDRALTLATSGWSRKTSSSYYLGTYTTTTGYQRTLTRSGARVRTLGVVVTLCSWCGRLELLLNGKRVGTVIDLHSGSTARRRVILLPGLGAVTTGTVTLRTRSSGHLVQVDGLVLSRV